MREKGRLPARLAIGVSVVVLVSVAGCKAQLGQEGNEPGKNGAVQVASGPTLNGILPAQVDLPADAPDPLTFRPNFDDFSWRSFIALMWPASNVRGEPANPTQPTTLTGAGNAYNAVWGTFRADYELYTGPNRPPPFDGPNGPAPFCGGVKRELVKFSKLGDPLSDTKEAFSFPLVDQNNNYIYYEIRFNRDQYGFVRGADTQPASWLYLAANLMKAEQAGPVSMPTASAQPYSQGSVMVKAAWKLLTPKDDASRYYTQSVSVYDSTQPAGQKCQTMTVGLIGFHIGRKLARFPEWVWSSFEQVDNVPPDQGSPAGPMTLNNGTDTPKTVGGWANRPDSDQPTAKRSPTQVTRFNPIPVTPAPAPGSGPWPYGAGSTVDVNNAYRQLLAGTVWANYQLVITQWPSNPSTFKTKEAGGLYPQGAGSPFPQQGAVNTAMETYFQSQRDAAGAGGNSCMQCHYGAGQSDFSWSLTLRAK